MDRVLGNEDTSNLPLLGDANGPELFTFTQTTLSTSSLLTPNSLSPSPTPNDYISYGGSSFNSGKKNKSKTPAVKSETLVDLCNVEQAAVGRCTKGGKRAKRN